MLQGYCPYPRSVPFVADHERCLPFPLALFSSNTDTTKYNTQYPFCTIVKITVRFLPKIDSPLFILTYSDLSEISLFVERLIFENPFSYFLFIPCQFIREAFKLMIGIFERQENRLLSTRPCDVDVKTHSYDFVTLLQGTLSASLGCAVPLLGPPFR
jgi:hypothetical protein